MLFPITSLLDAFPLRYGSGLHPIFPDNSLLFPVPGRPSEPRIQQAII